MELKLMLSLEMMGPTKGRGSKSEQILGQPRRGYSDTQYIGYLRQTVIKLGNLVAEIGIRITLQKSRSLGSMGTQVRIQDLSRGGPQLLRPKVADVAKRSRASEVSNLRLGSRAHLRALEAFGFLMLKYAFSHILETLFLSFLTSILTPNVDKNRALEFTSINLRNSYILHLFFNLHEKVML